MSCVNRTFQLMGALLLVLVFIMSGCGLFTETSEPTASVTEAGISTSTPPASKPGAPTETIVPTEPAAPAATVVPKQTRAPSATQTEASELPVVKVQPAPVFAVYEEPPVDVVAASFHDPIAPDLGNVRVPFILSETQRQRLAEQGFVVSPGMDKEFFTLYEKARYSNEPIFVTSDSLLHVYHLLFDKVLRTAEREYFIPLLQSLNQAMLVETDKQYQALKDTPWEDAARRTAQAVTIYQDGEPVWRSPLEWEVLDLALGDPNDDGRT